MKEKGTSEVSAICLLTDGAMNSGVTDSARLVTLTKEKIASFPASRAKPSVFTFGYGKDADATVMNLIAEGTGGSFYQINHPESVPLSFADCLGGLSQVAAQNIEMTCELSGGGAEFATIMTTFPTERLSGSLYKVKIKDMYCGEARDILFKVRIPQGKSDVGIQVSVSFIDNVAEKLGSLSSKSVVTRTPGNALPTGPGDVEVERHMVRLEAARAMEEARQKAERGDYEAASAQVAGMMQFSRMKQATMGLEGDAMLNELCEDLSEQTNLMRSKSVYESVGRAQTSAALASHNMQRSNKVDKMMSEGAEKSNAYATSMKKTMMSSAKQMFGYSD